MVVKKTEVYLLLWKKYCNYELIYIYSSSRTYKIELIYISTAHHSCFEQLMEGKEKLEETSTLECRAVPQSLHMGQCVEIGINICNICRLS